MTVAELKAILSQYPDSAEIKAINPEDGERVDFTDTMIWEDEDLVLISVE